MTVPRTTTKAADRMARAFLPEYLESQLDPAIAAAVAAHIRRTAVHIGYLPQKDELVVTFGLGSNDAAGETEIPGQTAIDDAIDDAVESPVAEIRPGALSDGELQ